MQPVTRRTLFAQAAALSGAAMLSGTAAARPLRTPPGIQLWMVKEDMARDAEGTLRALGRMGYKRIEAAGWHGRTPAKFRAAVRAAGLDCTAAHYGLKELMTDTDDKLAFARDVGCRYVVASSPAPKRELDPKKPWTVGMAEAMTLADWRSNAAEMNRIGRRARTMGLRFGYHNHAFELLRYDGKVPLDEIVRLTDPANVVLELDIGWAAGAGFDPVEVIRRYAKRIHLLHVKDLATSERVRGRVVKDERTTVIGAGTIDWKRTFRALQGSPVHSYFVEQEEPFTEPPLVAARKSLAYLRSLSI